MPGAQWGRDMRFLADYYGGNINVGINLSNLISGYNDRLIDFGIHVGFGQTQWQSQTFDLATDDVIASAGQKEKSGVEPETDLQIEIKNTPCLLVLM